MAVGAQKARLGRGLASLIGDRSTRQALGAESEQRSVPLAALKPGRFNPRRNFAEGAARGARRLDPRARAGAAARGPAVGLGETFEIVAGERRWRAAQLAQLHEVPVVVRAL